MSKHVIFNETRNTHEVCVQCFTVFKVAVLKLYLPIALQLARPLRRGDGAGNRVRGDMSEGMISVSALSHFDGFITPNFKISAK